jgi:intracellular septation protein
VLAAVFLASQFVGERNLLERLLGGQLSLTRRVWTQLNALWIGNFTLVGALNLFVAYRYEEAFWVSYKLYSSVGFTVVLMLLTILIVAPHLKEHDAAESEQAGGS